MVVPAGKETPGKRPQKCTQSNVGESVGFPFTGVDSAAYLSNAFSTAIGDQNIFQASIAWKVVNSGNLFSAHLGGALDIWVNFPRTGKMVKMWHFLNFFGALL